MTTPVYPLAVELERAVERMSRLVERLTSSGGDPTGPVPDGVDASPGSVSQAAAHTAELASPPDAFSVRVPDRAANVIPIRRHA